ncbi:energy transducer TonB [Acinetobacter soli]|uniref:energy transducer TonB n=1 Tax=Acinetobacter soli TaxID=487316 RepID=UPI00287EFC6F|nr:energy transducer TonB [Acinetobacter soli]MDS7693906.1 energy transducer TonB [Acinetobacter soli]
MKNILLCFLMLLPVNVFATDNSVKFSTKADGVQWIRYPRPKFKNDDLQGYDRSALVHFETDDKGVVTLAKIKKSSGLEYLDQKIIESVMKAKLRPYTENGISYPSKLDQNFELSVLRTPRFKIMPEFVFDQDELGGVERDITIYSEANQQGKVTTARIVKSSGIPELDSKVIKQFKEQTEFYPLNINGKPYPISDKTYFQIKKK